MLGNVCAGNSVMRVQALGEQSHWAAMHKLGLHGLDSTLQ